MPREKFWQLVLVLGLGLDFVGAVLVLSAVIDFTGKTFHGQVLQEVDYIDTELVKARQKAMIGLYFIVAGFILPVGKELYTLQRM